MKRIIGIIFTCFMALAVFHACASKEQVIQVTAVSINQPSAQMIIGETLKLTATVSPSDASEKNISWSSSQKSVASVSEEGLVTALEEGTTTITAASGGKSGSCVVTVSKGFVAVESVVLDYKELPMVEGDVFTLTATIKPDDATDAVVTWSSSDIEIATVDAGKVTAIREGEAVIQAKAGEKTAECKVTVSAKKIDVSAVQLSKTELSLIIGQEFTLTATIVPEDATVRTVEWSTSDADVATVEDGKVVAIKEGTATIKAEADGKTAECAVTVNYIHVQSITLDKPSATLYEGEEFTLNATITPEDATYSDITWTSNNPETAKVEGGKVVAIKKGTATIKAEADGKSALCQVEVLSSIAEISLSKSQLSMIIGDTETLEAIITPEDATLREEITWSSTDQNVATVDNNGKVTAIKEGTAIISATVEGKKAECKVTVDYIHVSSIGISQANATFYIGESLTLTAELKPSNVTYNTIEWVSSDNNVVTVSENGRVTAVGKGEATVTAKSDGKEATCHFTVLVPLTGLSFDQSSMELFNGASATLTVIKSPSDATLRGEIVWKSSDTSVATINADGLVTAIAKGSAKITASVDGCTAECAVSVLASVTGISISQASATINKGSSIQLSYTVLPAGATIQGQVSWASSNTSVATVDSQGKVKAVGAGTADITVSLEGFTATCKVTVTVPVSSITLNQGPLKLKQNETAQLVATVGPEDANDKTVTWSSSDTSIATVDSTGLVKALKEGTAVISAKAGDKTATCSLTVSNSTSGGHEGTGEEEWN